MLKRFTDNFYNLTTFFLRKINLKTQMRNNKSPSATMFILKKKVFNEFFKKKLGRFFRIY